MPNETSGDLKFEIGHVLFIDIVGYSKLSINEQSAQVETLKKIVQGTAQFRTAEAEGKLLRLPTGDGGALVFRNHSEAPVLCAMEISRALKNHPTIGVRMGIHSGPVNEITDLNQQANVAGAGINYAQRVMDCGDAGHILLSKHVAEDLAEYEQWRPLLHDLGACEVKHGMRLHVVNLCSDEVGSGELPTKLWTQRRRAARIRWSLGAAALLAVAAVLAGIIMLSRNRSSFTLAAPDKSIAVLPFENLSEEKQNAHFADGVQDEILTDLAKIVELKVISRTSVMQYKSGVARNLRQIAQELGVANVLEGSVQRAGDRVRVSAQLVDARKDVHLWAEHYDRPLDDVFAIQSEIAKAIADQLQAKLSPAEKKAIERPPTSDLTAFDLYTRAKNIILRFGSSAANERTNHLQAIDLLNQAVAQDPSFFDAYCQLAWVHDGLYFLGYDHTSARLALAEAAIQAAFRLRPDAGEAHLAEAQNLYQGYLDYDGALTELDVARQTLPNDPRVFLWKGLIERRQGRWEESTQDLERAIELDPRNFFTLGNTALSYEALRRYPQEKSMYDRVLAFEPNDPVRKVQQALVEFDSKADTRLLHKVIDSIRATNPAAISTIADAWLLCALAERDDAAAKNALMALGESPSNLGLTDNVLFNCPLVEGVIARMTKDDGKARSAFTAARAQQEKIVRAQPNYGPAMCALGLIDAGLGRKEEALREGRRAVELLPVEKDALNGSGMIKYLAMIAAWVGDEDFACEQLAIAIRSPSGLSYGQLKLLPFWDPLRGDPRFEKVVEEAKQPVALK